MCGSLNTKMLNVSFIKILTTKGCCKSFDLASQRTHKHVSDSEAAEAGEGANTGDQQVCNSQVHQDVVQMRPELLIFDSACNCERIYACTRHKYEKHERCHAVKGRWARQVILWDQEWGEG